MENKYLNGLEFLKGFKPINTYILEKLFIFFEDDT